MFIRCETQNYPDYYYIDGIESLEELQEYVKNNMPIMGRKIEHRYVRSAVLEDDCYPTLVYLNNYLNIYKTNLYFIDEKLLNKLQKEKCSTCLNYCQYWEGCDSRYKPDETNICANYREPKKVKKKWFKLWRM